DRFRLGHLHEKPRGEARHGARWLQEVRAVRYEVILLLWFGLTPNGLEWKGWHAYRRGLATNLHELGVPDKVIQAILRHEDVSTTLRSYIKTVPKVVTDAMKRLEVKIACA
ncbi:MAG TPA: tyrosine-type recombinase/integrase, partial [Candidatus Acidoferrum sp.]